ncbi:hypothetical protein J5Y09_06765 [Roseomonas sp. PWR1]|uniref:Uncharacterized protein n=1 Tax=Roseomonas nitratireducens TaxID=2820810 RepID=A0ABS4AQG9_9PROT|nr:hypothetical protein [Neoroseomonas nitratireducens]MBP0463605.1 hypothetical protein [Neoroseomonas nitratireducens]
MTQAPMRAAVLRAIKRLLAVPGGAVDPAQKRRLAYDAMLFRYGADQVGPWDDYEVKESGFWTLEACKADALNHQTRSAWKQASRGAYDAALREGWMDECCPHMAPVTARRGGSWTLEACKADALPHHTRKAWRQASFGAYDAALRNGWLDECCPHMAPVTARRGGSWTLEACKADAQNHQTRWAWAQASRGAYLAARRNGWLDLCCPHMRRPDPCPRAPKAPQARAQRAPATTKAPASARPGEAWTRESCLADARRHPRLGVWWSRSREAHDAAKRNGWLDECCAHWRQGRRAA